MKTTQEERRLIDSIRNSITKKTSRTIDIMESVYYTTQDICSVIAYNKFNDQSDERYEFEKVLMSRYDEFLRFVALKECPNAKVVTIYYKNLKGKQTSILPFKITR